MYYIKDQHNNSSRLLRYDDKDADFVAMNETLWGLAELNENDFSDFHSLHDYLASKGIIYIIDISY